MTQAGAGEQSTENRRKRLKFQCWHRGFKEIDLILGSFFDQFGADLSLQDLDDFEALLEETDQDLYNWIIGKEIVLKDLDVPVLRRLKKLDFLCKTDWPSESS